MKNAELKSLLLEVLKEELQEMYPHSNDEHGDGYSNEFQRAFAHSQSTTPRKNERNKAVELAKQGKYVVISCYDVHCKSTDAVLGQDYSINKVFDDAKSASDYVKDNGGESAEFHIVSPESVAEKPTTPTDDDVPFEEGYGMGDMSKDPKKAFKGARWTVKYDENISLKEVKSVIQELLLEESNGNDQPGHYEMDGPDRMTWSDIQEGNNQFFIITGRSGPQTTYYCNSATQGEKMIPSAMSMAYRFTDKNEALKKIEQLKVAYKGIQNWEVENVPDEADKSMYENSRPLYEAKGKTTKAKLVSIIKSVLEERKH